MAIFGNKVDFNQVHATSELIPAGMYQAIITASGGDPKDERTGEDGLVSSRSGTGRYLPMTFEIIQGDYKGRQIFKNFNLENNNRQAVDIALRELKELLLAVGWDFVKNPSGPNDTEEIHNIPMTLEITIRKDKKSDDERNEIKHFKPRQVPGMPAAAPAAGAKPAPAAAPAAAPWARNNNTTAPAAGTPPAPPAAPTAEETKK